MKIFKILTIVILLAVTSCAKKKEIKPTAELAYSKAYKLLQDKNYSEAGDAFEKIDDDFPFSKWSKKGQTMAVYARYKDQDYDNLLQVCDDFLRLNPASEYVPYMLYMKGLSHYNQIPTIERSQQYSQEASYIFRELAARFATTKYAIDAKLKLPFIDEHLAGAQMSIGRYEISVQNYVGAIKHFSYVVERYRQTKQVPEAYFRLVEIYYRIGLNQEAMKAALELKYKFPDDQWTKELDKFASL